MHVIHRGSLYAGIKGIWSNFWTVIRFLKNLHFIRMRYWKYESFFRRVPQPVAFRFKKLFYIKEIFFIKIIIKIIMYIYLFIYRARVPHFAGPKPTISFGGCNSHFHASWIILQPFKVNIRNLPMLQYRTVQVPSNKI